MESRTSFTYDPLRQGYDTGLWKTLSGTVTTGEYLFVDTDSLTEEWDIASDGVTLAESVSVTIS